MPRLYPMRYAATAATLRQQDQVIGITTMTRLISGPTRIQAQGQPPKVIEEYVGRVNSATTAVSVARMISPMGWSEPGQTPEFSEFTIVLRGTLHIETRAGAFRVEAGQGVIVD